MGDESLRFVCVPPPPGGTLYKCSMCGSVFGSYAGLLDHWIEFSPQSAASCRRAEPSPQQVAADAARAAARARQRAFVQREEHRRHEARALAPQTLSFNTSQVPRGVRAQLGYASAATNETRALATHSPHAYPIAPPWR